jgi:hypothetical protein
MNRILSGAVSQFQALLSFSTRFSEVRIPRTYEASRFNGFPGKPLKRFGNRVARGFTSLKRGVNEIPNGTPPLTGAVASRVLKTISICAGRTLLSVFVLATLIFASHYHLDASPGAFAEDGVAEQGSAGKNAPNHAAGESTRQFAGYISLRAQTKSRFKRPAGFHNVVMSATVGFRLAPARFGSTELLRVPSPRLIETLSLGRGPPILS